MNNSLNELRQTTKYVIKNEEWFTPIFYDDAIKRLVIRKTSKRKRATDKNTKTYEEVSQLYNVEIASETRPKPDEYFLKKVTNTTDMYRTVTDKTLRRYLKEHLEDCFDATEKLKEIIMTNENNKVRQGAFDTLKEVGAANLDELEQYLGKGIKKKESTESVPKEFEFGSLSSEKTLLVYMSVAARCKDNRTNIRFGLFNSVWDEMFEADKQSREYKIKAFKQAHTVLDRMSMEEIQEYRNTFSIYEGTEVPVDMKKLAQEKNVSVTLAENRNKRLSGFDVLVREGRTETFRINPLPYSLSEDAARKILQSLPTKSELVQKQNELKQILRDENVSMKQKKKAVDSYKAKYATHDFKLFMNRFTIKECKNQQLTLLCVNLCNRVGISNLANNAPIVYKFCEGSGKRKQSLKRVRARRKGNEKAARKRK